MAHRNQIVEERPDDLVGEPGVEPVPLGLRQRDGDELVAEAAAGVLEERRRIGKLLLAGPRPPDPSPAAVAEHRRRAVIRPPLAGSICQPPVLLVARDGERKAVGHDHESHGRSEEQAAFHSSRKSRSSPGGRSQASARVGRFSGRTRTARPRPAIASKASSSVRSSPRYATAAPGPSSANARSTTLALVEAARPQLDASVERLELETVGERAGGHALAQHRLGETIERRARAPRVERDSERLPLGDGPGADAIRGGKRPRRGGSRRFGRASARSACRRGPGARARANPRDRRFPRAARVCESSATERPLTTQTHVPPDRPAAPAIPAFRDTARRAGGRPSAARGFRRSR